MDGIFFNFLLNNLSPLLKNNYIKKVYSPFQNVIYFELSQRKFLFFVYGNEKTIFLTDFKLTNPLTPSSQVMFLRKHLVGGRITDVMWNWIKRNMALEVLRGENRFWVLFDFKDGIILKDKNPVQSIGDFIWPALEDIVNNENIYRIFPNVTPLLRKELKSRRTEDACDLLDLVKNNKSEGFFLYRKQDRVLVSPWRLSYIEDGEDVVLYERYDDVLECAARFGCVLLEKIKTKDGSDFKLKKEIKKIKKALCKIEEDRKRLEDYVKKRKDALIIQQNLYRFDPRRRYKEIKINSKTFKLDPSLTLLENMEKMFKLSRKGERGISLLENRRKELESRLQELEKGRGDLMVEKKLKNINLNPYKALAKKNRVMVQSYKTEDGFLIIRGKDKRSNHMLLSQMCSPFDLWFHVEGGPGAHVILKRDYPHQSVPERSMIQAASIAALFSYQKYSTKASVICAMVKDIRKLKGGELGMVKVNDVMKSFFVDINKELEEKLRVKRDESC